MDDFEEKKGHMLDEHTLQFTRLLPGPIERVWAYLTEPDKRARWFAGGPMKLEKGGAITFEHDHAQLSDVDEEIPEKYKSMEGGVTTKATVKRAEAPGLLSFDWHDDDGSSQEVTIALQEEGDKVHLTLTHRQLREAERVSVSGGWHSHLETLEEELEGRKRSAIWARSMALEDFYSR